MARIPTYRFRRWHRYLGVVLGVQILLWTASGIYFTWTDLDEIHGDHLRRPLAGPALSADWISPWPFLADTGGEGAVLRNMTAVNIDGTPCLCLRWSDGEGESRAALVNALTGDPRDSLNRDEAVALARQSFSPAAEVRHVTYLTEADIGPHHEYRSGPLPAWQITFDHGSGTRVYVAAETARVTAHRNAGWRVFDTLWMMHTMDFFGRDDINNPVLRIVAPAALVTTLSGFTLFFLTSRRRRQRPR